MSRLIIGIVLTVIHVVVPNTAHADWTTAKQQKSERLLRERVAPFAANAADTTPAISAAIGIGGRLVYADGFGAANSNSLASASTRYRIGSISKQFTAATMLKLLEGKSKVARTGANLSLDTLIGDIIPGGEYWQIAGQRPITLDSLLSMTSNLPNFTRRPPPGADPWGSVSASALLSAVRKFEPRGWPGTFEYSNTNYFLVAEAIEAIAIQSRLARSYQDYVRRFIIQPAGLNATGFIGDELQPSEPLAIGNYRRRPAFLGGDWLKGSADIVSTVIDLDRWMTRLLAGSVIRPSSLDLMLAERARVSPLEYYGMGWFIEQTDGYKVITHSGSVPGFTSYVLAAQPTRGGPWVTVALLTSSDGLDWLETLAQELWQLALPSDRPGAPPSP